jgi:ferrous iron transport protein B
VTSTAPGIAFLGPTISKRPRRVALAGNPNVGKSSLYNALTGLRQKVSNYPGTTVEKIVGKMSVQGGTLDVVDLPGAYSLLARSPDEAVGRDEILGRIAGDPAPDVVVVVVDASNLERNLFLATQILDTGRPCVVALNQADLALERGITVDVEELSRRLGVPVVPTNGRTGQGRDALAAAIAAGGRRAKPVQLDFAIEVREEAALLAPLFASRLGGLDRARREIGACLASEASARDFEIELARVDASEQSAAALTAFRTARERLVSRGVDVATGTACARYAAVAAISAVVVTDRGGHSDWRARLDRVLLHRVFGSVALLAVFAFLFAVVFWFSKPLIDLVDGGMKSFGGWVGDLFGGGLFGDFVANGLVAGFGAFLVFVPQIALLFVCIETLEDSGYLARAAFLLDRAMGKVGLPGRAFLPLLSGFACAIPGIMATRTMSNVRDRLATMAVLPLMSCSARLPVYGMIVAALFSAGSWWVAPLVFMSMYLVGIFVAVLASSVLRRTVLRGGKTPLLLELPPYRVPAARTVARNTGRRTWSFVAGAGPIILVLSMALWALATFPRTETTASADPEAAHTEQLEKSYIGHAGKFIEPGLRPLGFDWKIGIGILSSFAARETFVPTLGVIYGVRDTDDAEAAAKNEGLLDSIRHDRWPANDPERGGRAIFTPLVGISLLVFYVLALQCMSTLAILKRETNSWRWPVGLFVAYTAVAYAASFLVFQAGSALGF